MIACSCLSDLHADHLGRPVFGTDAEGTVVWRGGITTPFGVSVTGASALSAPGATPLRFPGQYADAETARGDGGADASATLWHYNHHRTYDPALGRYLQSDPIGLQGGINRYAYVGGNPVRWVDPTGEVGKQFREAWTISKEEYENMKRRNVEGGDKYAHCMANCRASKLGDDVQCSAEFISSIREAIDYPKNRLIRQMSDAEAKADMGSDFAENYIGQFGPKTFPNQSCSNICGKFFPISVEDNR